MSDLGSAIVSTAASLAVLAVMFVPLERAFPARRQRVLRRDLVVDLCFFLGQYLAFSSLSVGVLTLVAHAVRGPAELRALVDAWPLLAQGLAALVLGDVVVYWFHRACHAVPLLWRFHAVHHSAEELDWLAAHREHPLDGLGTQLALNAPAVLLGVDVRAVAALAVFRGLWAIYVHSNARVPLGPLRLVFGAPELHHWHHARVAATKHNFANLAPWLDVLFGTYHCPPLHDEERYPLGLVEPAPRGWLAQLVWPFTRS